MEIFANLTSNRHEPGAFAALAEQQGFDGVTCSDHYWLREVFPHLWVSLAAMACATERVTVAWPSLALKLNVKARLLAVALLTTSASGVHSK